MKIMRHPGASFYLLGASIGNMEPERMNKRDLAWLIHECNDACTNRVLKNEICENCYRVAGQIFISMGNALITLGTKRLKDEKP